MTRILVDKFLEKQYIDKLKSYGFNIYFTHENRNLLKGISAHPDMLVHKLDEKNLVVDNMNYLYYKNIFKDINIIKSNSKLIRNYPYDIALNAFSIYSIFVHKLKCTDKIILDWYERNNYELIDVKQGYSKCSCLVGNDFVITSDYDIYNKLKSKINIYKIDHKQIELNYFNYGFIGGCSGLVGDILFLYGNFKNHSSFEYIKDIFKLHRQEYVCLSDDNLKDFGGIIEI